MSDDKLTRLRELAMTATSGPWSFQRPQVNKWVNGKRTNIDCDHHKEDEYESLVVGELHQQEPTEVIGYFACGSHHLRIAPADADFIAACDPATVLALLDERDALAARLAELEEEWRQDAMYRNLSDL